MVWTDLVDDSDQWLVLGNTVMKNTGVDQMHGTSR
jgi:hypothetical protein